MHVRHLKDCAAHGPALKDLVYYMERIEEVRDAKANSDWKRVVAICGEIGERIGSTIIVEGGKRYMPAAGFLASTHQLDQCKEWSLEKKALCTLVGYLTSEAQRSTFITSESESECNIAASIEECTAMCQSEESRHILKLAKAIRAMREETGIHPESALGTSKDLAGTADHALGTLKTAILVAGEEQRFVRAATSEATDRAHGAYSELPLHAVDLIVEEVQRRGAAYVEKIILRSFENAVGESAEHLRSQLCTRGTRKILSDGGRDNMEGMRDRLSTFCSPRRRHSARV